MTQADKTGDEQRRAGDQRDRERDLRANENFTETLLANAAGCAAAAFFQAHRRDRHANFAAPDTNPSPGR